MNANWAAGDTVVVQEVWRDRVWAARPMRVVRDEGDFAALWFPKGTQWKAPTLHPTLPWAEDRGARLAACAASGRWVFRDGVWDVSTLALMRGGDWHAVWISWLDTGEQWGWYVNLQLPFRRTRLGFETMDLMLDVIVELDRSWRWKDEDELAAFVEHGALDVELAERVREEGLAVARRAERGEPPFDGAWTGWRPDPAWERPELPPGWDELCR
jgi:predicted RNA-binding protein associated with RNAse of E/G family